MLTMIAAGGSKQAEARRTGLLWQLRGAGKGGLETQMTLVTLDDLLHIWKLRDMLLQRCSSHCSVGSERYTCRRGVSSMPIAMLLNRAVNTSGKVPSKPTWGRGDGLFEKVQLLRFHVLSQGRVGFGGPCVTQGVQRLMRWPATAVGKHGLVQSLERHRLRGADRRWVLQMITRKRSCILPSVHMSISILPLLSAIRTIC